MTKWDKDGLYSYIQVHPYLRMRNSSGRTNSWMNPTCWCSSTSTTHTLTHIHSKSSLCDTLYMLLHLISPNLNLLSISPPSLGDTVPERHIITILWTPTTLLLQILPRPRSLAKVDSQEKLRYYTRMMISLWQVVACYGLINYCPILPSTTMIPNYGKSEMKGMILLLLFFLFTIGFTSHDQWLQTLRLAALVTSALQMNASRPPWSLSLQRLQQNY